ncbi:hypothetical protein F5Y00DRAFT_213018 [Daldinia vernicosa]|uniref:uncharacterized protein n=1 Tax=Daldinia vernicosa TaxID=114800 RepID=UPI002008920F|nr:uncharacterized protein F5Y00DRAFT_213018 [Daldinia vernicosa]KAI0844008.1 hypothetical protein F5Y00DRAFT_213018 [Daldinia vernicosa]
MKIMEDVKVAGRKCEWSKHMDKHKHRHKHKHSRPYKCLPSGCETCWIYIFWRPPVDHIRS